MANEYKVKNFRVPVSVKAYELPFSEELIVKDMAHIFQTSSPSMVDCMRKIIGEDFIQPESPRIIFPSNLLSIFLSNTLDMVQSFEALRVVVSVSMIPGILDDDELSLVQKYNFDSSEENVAGIFHKKNLKKIKGFAEVYFALKMGLRYDDTSILYIKISWFAESLGGDMIERFKVKYFVVSYLLHRRGHRVQ